jgi:hypothetical protein
LPPRHRIVVAQDMENNARLHLLSASRDQVAHGVKHYQRRSLEASMLVYQILKGYEREGMVMSYTLKDFRRDFVEQNMKDFTAEERLRGLSPEERMQGLSREEIGRLLQLLKRHPAARGRKKKTP